MIAGEAGLFVATSARERSALGSNLVVSATVTSPEPQNEKKVTTAATQSITEVKSGLIRDSEWLDPPQDYGSNG